MDQLRVFKAGVAYRFAEMDERVVECIQLLVHDNFLKAKLFCLIQEN